MIENQEIYNIFDRKMFEYKGKGILQNKYNSVFNIFQNRNGEIYVFFEFEGFISKTKNIKEFYGITENGDNILVTGINISRVTNNNFSKVKMFGIADKVSLIKDENLTCNIYRFGLTNFKFSKYSKNISSAINISKNVSIKITPVENYKTVIEKLEIKRNIDVTAEIETTMNLKLDIEKIINIINNITYLMSLAKGNKIQYIYCKQLDKNGRTKKIEHYSRVAKPYCGIPLIADDISVTILEFIEKTYHNYIKNKNKFNINKIIDAHLDAKSEQDYLEFRGLKLSIVLEMIINSFASDNKDVSYIINPQIYSQLKGIIKNSIIDDILTDEKVEREKLKIIASDGKIMGLNRTSFSSKLKKLLDEINLSYNSKTRNKFISSRNTLVHQGRFNYQDKNNKSKFQSVNEEYFFMLNIIHEILLKIVGYNDEYFDWSKPNNPTINNFI